MFIFSGEKTTFDGGSLSNEVKKENKIVVVPITSLVEIGKYSFEFFCDGGGREAIENLVKSEFDTNFYPQELR